MAGQRRTPLMKDRYRKDDRRSDRDEYRGGDQRRYQSPERSSRRSDRPDSSRDHQGKLDRGASSPILRDQSSRREYSPVRRNSRSPVRSIRGAARGGRNFVAAGRHSRDSSLERLPKRRRTRSPSPAQSDKYKPPPRRNYSRSRSRERFESREQRRVDRRDTSPRRNSPSHGSRPVSRQKPPDIDSYIPPRRYNRDPPPPVPQYHHSPRRRSITPPLRRRSRTPPARRPRISREPSPRRLDTLPARRKADQGSSPRHDTFTKRRARSRSPPVEEELNRSSMDGPYPMHNNHDNYGKQGSMNHRGGRGRGYNNRGSLRRGSSAGTPYGSQHGSPQSHYSYYDDRNIGHNGPQPRQYDNNQQSQHHSPPQRRPSFTGAGQSQEEYFRSSQQGQSRQNNHPTHQQNQGNFNPPQNLRGGRGRGRGRGDYNQQLSERGYSDHSLEQQEQIRQQTGQFNVRGRGRGSNHLTSQWSGGKKGNHQQISSENLHPKLQHRQSREFLPREDEPSGTPPKSQEVGQNGHQDNDNIHPSRRQLSPPSAKDGSKISFSFKSKPPVEPLLRPAKSLNTKLNSPPAEAQAERLPPSGPRNKGHDRKVSHNNYQIDNRGRAPPSGPQNHNNRPSHSQTQYSNHSRTQHDQHDRPPPAKKLKLTPDVPPGPGPRPTLPPEYAASESVYYRKAGNASVIGAGTYGKVFKAIHIYTQTPVALKKIRMEGERDGFPITAVREIKLLQSLTNHPHVVSLQEVMVEKNECFMVFEYLSHDLTGLINHPKFVLTPSHKKDLGRQIFSGLEFLHRRGVMHRDIKAANLLVSSTGLLKYADFGLARTYTKRQRIDYTNRVITIWYRPPELLLGETQYGPAIDVWSAAAVFMEMFTKKAIFPGEGGELSQLEKIYSVLGAPSAADWPEMTSMPWYELMEPAVGGSPGSHRDIPCKRVFETQYASLLSPAALDLVQQVFQYDPTRRPDCAAILQHDYFVSELPEAKQAIELADVGGEWHEYESKAHRKENDRKEREKRKAEYHADREKKKKESGDGLGGSVDTASRSANGGKPANGKIDEVPAAPLPVGEEEARDSDHRHEHDEEEEEGSARMSMS